MNQLTTRAIVLTRTNYGEADRIITVLTTDYGRLHLIAKGVRRVKSKLAGGIELFSVSHITFVRGRGEIGTLISTRLLQHYGHIIDDLERVQLGYDLTKLLNKVIEDNVEQAYFDLLRQLFEALDDESIAPKLIQLWFQTQVLRLAGHRPNLYTDTTGNKLDINMVYEFDFDTMAFKAFDEGKTSASHIKYLRLLFSNNPPKILSQVRNSEQLVQYCWPIVQRIYVITVE